MTMESKGRDLVSGIPKTVTINSDEVREALSEPVYQIVEAVRHLRAVTGGIRELTILREEELATRAKELQAPLEVVRLVAKLGKLPEIGKTCFTARTFAEKKFKTSYEYFCVNLPWLRLADRSPAFEHTLARHIVSAFSVTCFKIAEHFKEIRLSLIHI